LRRKKVLVTALLIIAVGFSGVKGFLAYVESNLQALGKMTLAQIDLQKIEDGVYFGSHSTFPVSADVRVSVKDHMIAGIEIVKHTNGQGAAAEAIPGKVLESQTLQVDCVSGATYSSKVLLKAIENALLGATE